MNKHQFERITEWQKETFPSSTALSKIEHLAEELTEVVREIVMPTDTDGKNKKIEFADCFILLMGAAAAEGMTYWDVVDAINEKHKINLSRKWGEPDENGVVKHLK